MKKLIIMAALGLNSITYASDYGDKNCNIFVSKAENEITGCCGNFLNATVVVSKALIEKDFKNYKVKIVGYENALPLKIFSMRDKVVFEFVHYAPGIEYHGGSASVTAYIDNGIDRLYDNNDNVLLVPEHNWHYTSPNCR